MVLGATLLELFLLFVRKTRNNKFIKFMIDKVLVEKQVDNPNFEVILWCTIFWPILALFYIIMIPTIGFTYIIDIMFTKFEGRYNPGTDYKEEDNKDA